MISSLKAFLWRWTIRRLRGIVWAADEWIHTQELKIRESAPAPVAAPAEVDRKQSARREREHRKQTRAARPRLVYANGQFQRKVAR
jgi:hypothetical protein